MYYAIDQGKASLASNFFEMCNMKIKLIGSQLDARKPADVSHIDIPDKA